MNDDLRIQLEQHRDKLLEGIRSVAPKEADELKHVLILLCRHGSNSEETPPKFEVLPNQYSDNLLYPSPKIVILEILRKYGPLKPREIMQIAIDGGWRRGSPNPGNEILYSINAQLGKYGPKKKSVGDIVMNAEGLIELVEG